jgi:hypothetical protein
MRRLCLVLLLALVAPASAHAAPLRLGLLDGAFAEPATGPRTLQEAAGLGATVARIPTGWGGLAPTRPAVPEDPSDPAYRWEGLDEAVRQAAAAGLEPLVSLTGAPEWAEGAGRPTTAGPGAWKPDARAYGQFARALARHFDGTTPGVPRVRSFQAWNEPNLEKYLAPQFVGRTPFGARRFRELLNAFHDGIKAAQRDAIVVSGGTGPFGDPVGGRRTMPALFARELLCLDARLRRRPGCRGTTRFDVLAHHPYGVGGPFRKALNADDVTLPDIRSKLGRILRAAERRGTAPGRHEIWATELGWDSSPPDPRGVPSATHARWTAEALYQLARQGVRVAVWYQVRDQRPGDAGFAFTSQSGLLLADGRPKLAATAFRRPFVALRRGGRRIELWVRPWRDGTLVVRRTRGGGAMTVTRRTVSAGQSTTFRVTGTTSDRWDVALDGERSLTLRARLPVDR